MANTVVFLWISAASLPGAVAEGATPATLPAPIPAHALTALRDFGAARGLGFVAVSASRPRGLRANDAALVDAVEADLEQARTALAALEEDSANARLHKVEAELLAHPHLPQAAFLMGECFALQAQAARPHDPAKAAELDALRLALEGVRAPAFGEQANSANLPAKVTLDLQGLDATDELELDGVLLPRATRVAVLPGLHQARVWRGERTVFATFVRVAPEQRALALAVPALVPCSGEDLERFAEAGSAGSTALPGGVACQSWAKVRAEGAGIGVALCAGDVCGPFLHWQPRPPTPFAPIAVERQRLPTWAGFVIAGGAALVASSIVLWQSGAFERGKPAAASWEYRGLNPQGLRF